MVRIILRQTQARFAVVGALSLFLLAGCGGPKRVPVAGTVTLDGQPVQGGLLRFVPDESQGNTARVSCTSKINEGRYTLQTGGVTRADSGSGAPPGWYKITLVNHLAGQAPVEVNSRFLSAETTPIKIEVVDNPKPGAYDIALTR